MVRRLLSLLAALLAAACVATEPAPPILSADMAVDAAAVEKGTLITVNRNTGWTELRGPTVRAGTLGKDRRYMISSNIDKEEPQAGRTYTLQVAAGFPKRVYLKKAYAEGRPLPTKLVDRERRECGYQCAVVETMNIALSVADLERYAKAGLTFEIRGRRDRFELSVPAGYFAGVLAVGQRTGGT